MNAHEMNEFKKSLDDKNTEVTGSMFTNKAGFWAKEFSECSTVHVELMNNGQSQWYELTAAEYLTLNQAQMAKIKNSDSVSLR